MAAQKTPRISPLKPGTLCIWRPEGKTVGKLITFTGYTGEGPKRVIQTEPALDVQVRHRDLVLLNRDDPVYIVAKFCESMSKDPIIMNDWGLLSRSPAKLEGKYSIEIKVLGATGQMALAWLDGRVICRAQDLCQFLALEQIATKLRKAGG